VILVRENTEGLYVGVEHFVPVDGDPRGVAESLAIITRGGCRRIAEFTFDYAVQQHRRKVTIVHKANILKAVSGLFLETVREVGERYRDRIEIEDRIVDNCAMQLVLRPEQFDVIVTTNMFGDILSDQIAGLVGGLGLAPGANIGHEAAIFEAVHGSAPDIAGQGIANPAALLLAAGMMLDHVGDRARGDRLRDALEQTIRVDAIRTPDLGGDASTAGFAGAVADRLR
jgi:isocitrate dehydrogenase (NAD+)